MSLDDDPRAGVFLLREDEHFQKPCAIRPRGGNRSVAAGLVDHQHIARFRRRGAEVKARVFGQMRLGHLRHAAPRAVQ